MVRLNVVVALAALLSTYPPVAGQMSAPPSPEQIARMRAVGRIRATLGSSGLRRQLTESASLGEVQNRAASYRIITQVERARRAELEGRIAAITSVLSTTTLPAAERERLQAIVEESRAALTHPPLYRARYWTFTLQEGSLANLGLLRRRSFFLLTKARFARRTDPEEYLQVATGGVDIAPTLFLTPTFFIATGLTAGRTTVDVLAFHGTSASSALGLRLDLGMTLDPHWAAGLHIHRSWSWGRVDVLRPGPDSIRITSAPSTTTLAAKLELMGRFSGRVTARLPDFLDVAPRLGIYGIRTTYDSVTNSLGQRASGLFGDSDDLAILAAGVAFDFDIGGRVTPDLYIGVDHELPGALSDVIAERAGYLLGCGLTYALGRSSRFGVAYTYARSQGRRRRANELDFVAVLDF